MTVPAARPAARPRLDLALALLLVAIVGVVFGRTLGHDFVNFDDTDYVTANPNVLGGLTGANVRWAFTSFHSGHWHPLTWLSHMVDVELFGRNATGHHATNVVLFGVDCALLFVALLSLTRARAASFAVVLLFAVHPLRVESVAWVTGRKDVLSLLFFALTLFLWSRWARDRARWAYVAALVAFALALMSKPLVMTLPALLLTLDLWPLDRVGLGRPGLARRVRALVAEKLPFFALSAGSLTVTLLSQSAGGAVVDPGAWGIKDRVLHAAESVFAYLGLLAWPVDLGVFYPLRKPMPGLGAIALIALVVGTAWLSRRARSRPLLLAGWMWWLVALLPIIGLVQVGGQSVADRYALLPSIGALAVVVFARPRWLSGARGTVAVVAVSVVFALLSFRQAAHWRDSESLWTRTLSVTGENFMAHNNLGAALQRAGRLDEADQHFAEAYRLRPGYPPAALNHANSLARRGEYAAAEPRYKYAIERRPTDANARYNYGLSLARQKRWDEAMTLFEDALRLNPQYAYAHLSLGDVYRRRGQTAQARAHFEHALRLSPQMSEARRLLAALDQGATK
jgi:tetratricopeptide (TPR) repeat protein